MQRNLIDKLCCPFDKNDLTLSVFQEDDQNRIYEGLLTCTHCQRYFPIIYGIPIMTPDEYRQKSLESPVMKKWGLKIEERSDRYELQNTEEVQKIGE